MLTRLRIRNFKPFQDVDIELGRTVVFVGPNNSGKTAALQALALWEVGLRRWLEKRSGEAPPEKRPGVAINRRDLLAMPVPNAKLLWKDLRVRRIQGKGGKQRTSNIRIDVVITGITDGQQWECGLQFDYANPESFYCKPSRTETIRESVGWDIPKPAREVRTAFLPPMSGLAAEEDLLQTGSVNERIGEGRTAEVVRNLCYGIWKGSDKRWEEIVRHIEHLFGVKLGDPEYQEDRGKVVMSYRERSGVRLDLSSSGRGLQQTLLLLAYLYANPGSALLIDEPDAHLEILRQRQTYQLVTEVAEKQGSQVIIATHSEVVLNEAADRDLVIAFVGRPHRIDDRGSQVLKALKDIGYDQYYQAEQTGWVLYLEGSNDLAILREFARLLEHPAGEFLERVFVRYVENKPEKAREHYYGLREAIQELVGVALFDRLDMALDTSGPLRVLQWRWREIENYFCFPETLLAYAESGASEGTPEPLFQGDRRERQRAAMQEAVDEITSGPPRAREARSFFRKHQGERRLPGPSFEKVP
jgi:ABC-type transport system involved in cytochrome c biogenesis ATPase subunit